jgi:myosin I
LQAINNLFDGTNRCICGKKSISIATTHVSSLSENFKWKFAELLLRCSYSLTNSVYKSLQDNNEEQCIIMLGESGAGKTENSRMIVKFLSRISGKFLPLERQRSSNSLPNYKSSSNSLTTTPKHKRSELNSFMLVNDKDKSSCFKSENNRIKKMSRVEFDFSYQKSDGEQTKFCPKHNCNPIFSSSSSNSSNAIEIPNQKKSIYLPMTSRSVPNETKIPNCLNHRHMQNKCESLDFLSENNLIFNTKAEIVSNGSSSKVSSLKVTKSTQINSQQSYKKKDINLDIFKRPSKRKVPIKIALANNSQDNTLLEILNLKERIAQAETFLEAMGCACTNQNRDSSRYVSGKTICGR